MENDAVFNGIFTTALGSFVKVTQMNHIHESETVGAQEHQMNSY